MFESLLTIVETRLFTISDAIDVYEGSIPPAATFQVIDIDGSTIIEEPPVIEDPTRAN